MSERVAIILAAGGGTRMGSPLPKVLHPLKGKPLLEWVLDAAAAANLGRSVVVVGHGGDEVQERASRPGVEGFRVRERRVQESENGSGSGARPAARSPGSGAPPAPGRFRWRRR